MIENTGNIVAVSKILGHADIRTTMRYAHPEQSLIDATESLNRGFFRTRWSQIWSHSGN